MMQCNTEKNKCQIASTARNKDNKIYAKYIKMKII